MSALLLHITGLLCGIVVPYTAAQHPREIQIHTLKGNSMGKPCVFPFKYNNTWHHECTKEGRNDGMPWCATTKNYDIEKEWGYCPISGDGCDLLWEENNVTHICYQFNLQSVLSWKAARMSCQAQGGDLLSIMNLAEQNYISEKLKNVDTMLWIGLNHLDGLFGWQWSDGAALAFVNWKTNSTAWDHERRHCGMYYAGEHKWHSFECESKLTYACKKYLTPRQRELYENWKYYPTQCESNWIPYNQRCFKLQKEEFSWSEASAACRSDGAELMSVNSLADVEFLVHLLDHENISEVWIGMSSENRHPVDFKWSDGSAVTFASWQRHEPNIGLEGSDLCVSAQRPDGNWKVRPCSRKLFSVCKKPGQSETKDVTDEQCAENWVRHGAYCYGTDLRNQTFLQVEGDSNCPPVTITNRFEQAFINSLISSRIIPGDSHFWIALQDLNQTGEYSWLVNGSEDRDVSFTNWGAQEPSHNGGCVVLSSGLYEGRWAVKDCKGFFAKSLCKKPLGDDVERQSNPHEGNMNQACTPSWETEPHLHHCYKVFHHEKLMRKRSWQEAEDLCQDFGAHLVSLSTLEEKQFLEELLSTVFNGDGKRQFWIGLNKRNPSSKNSWEWSDGSPVLSSLWRDKYPKDVLKNCAAYGADMQLVPLNCKAHVEWICKIPKGVIPKTPDWLIKDFPWVFYQGHNYLFYDTNADFDLTRFICGWMRSSITSILTEAEQAFIHRNIKQMSKEKQKWWIGLDNEYDEFHRWRDGSFVIYTNWKTDPQSNSSIAEEQCAYIESDTGLWSFSNCTSANSVICKTNIMFKIEKQYTSVNNDHDQEYGICPKDWLYYGNKCFFVYNDGIMEWYSASNFCKEHGGDLAKITSEIEQAFIVMQLFGEKRSFWIGVSKNDYDSWENGTAETYNNWTPTRYSHDGVDDKDQLCALMSADHDVHPTGKWYLEKCSPKGYGFICEKKQDISNHAINGSDMFPVSETMKYGNKTYRILSGNMSWYDALTACQKYGNHLGSITDQYHQAFVTILVHRLGYPHWIGSYSSDSSEDFRWTDGSMSLFTSWAHDESPSDGNCVYTDTSGYWRAEDCDKELQGALCLPSTGTRYDYYFDGCPDKWIQFHSFCYSIYTALHNKQFYKAEAVCKEQGGEMLTILDEEEASFIQYEVKTLTSVQSIWLNRITPRGKGKVAWSDGSLVKYSKWSDETMDVNRLVGDYCVSMLMDDATWRTAQCYERRGFVCKKEAVLVSCFDTTYRETHHFIIPIAVVSTVVVSILLIILWYLLKRKRCLSSPNIQRLQCTQPSPGTDDVELCIPIADLNNSENQ